MAIPSLSLNSGNSIPQLGLGTWLSKPGEVGEAVRMALEVGYRHIDCAQLYENQEEIGEVFGAVFKSGKVKREDVFITSKIWNSCHSYDKATQSIENTLKELQISYLDLMLIHFPMGYDEKDGMHPKDADGKVIYSDIDYLETWKAMENAVKNGKVRTIGLSNFNTKQIERVVKNSIIKPAVLQIEAHPYFVQNGLLEWCKKNGIVVTVYSPLANPGHAFRKEGQPNLFEEKVILDIAEKHKKTPAQVAIRWAIQRGTVVIPKSIRRVRLEENANVFDFKLTSDDMAAINGLDRNWRMLGLENATSHPHYPFHENA